MRIHRCYCDQILSLGHIIQLKGTPAHHLIRVLRVKTGDFLILFNGDLYEYSCRINKISQLNLELSIMDKTLQDRRGPYSVHLGQSIIKNHPMDWLLQKATELGVASITPLWSEYTSLSLDAERLLNKMTHWKNIVVQAAEQCGRTEIPTLHAPMPLKQWVAGCTASIRLCLDPGSSQGIAQTLISLDDSIALLVGPEGGLSSSEIANAKENHFQSVQLGLRILRAETATLAALAVLQNI